MVNNQRGVVPILILIAAIGLIAFLVVASTASFKGGLFASLFPKKSSFASEPIGGETSFTLKNQNSQTPIVGISFKVDLYARSDNDQANLYNAQINFPAGQLQVQSIDEGNSGLVDSFVEKSFDNSAGTISIIASKPNPGSKTVTGQSYPPLATVTFRPINVGLAALSFTGQSAIYRNSDNVNILSIKNPLDLNINAGLTLTPQPTPTPVSFSGPGEHCGGNIINPKQCTTGYVCIPDPNLPAGDAGGTCQSKQPSPSSTPTAVCVPSHGDANKDGQINGIDYTIWSNESNFELTNGAGTSARTADFNCDGKVNQADKDIWQQGFTGQTPSPSAFVCPPNAVCATPFATPTPSASPCPNDFISTIENVLGIITCVAPTPTPTPVPTAEPLVPSSGPAASGDGNGDGNVNLVDLSVLLSDFNKTSGIRVGIDMNGDGVINSFDFSLMTNILKAHGVIH